MTDIIIRLRQVSYFITAHQTFFTREALEQIATTTLRNLEELEQGIALSNEVKPS